VPRSEVCGALSATRALASIRFQRGPVENHDHAAAVRDPADDFELLRGKRYTFAANTDHVGDQLLGHAQHIVIDSIEAEEQPLAKLLLERVMPVAQRGLRGLGPHGLHVAKEHALDDATALELALQGSRLPAHRIAGTLDRRSGERRLAAQDQPDAHAAFAPDE
jgi:hypothetical protein